MATKRAMGLLVPREFSMTKPAQLKQIKILLPAGDHDRVRLAAALGRVAMAEFCRSAAVTAANQATKGLSLPEADKTGFHKSR